MDEPLELRAIPELRRCVNELGFVGCLINPDPTEGLGDPPGMGDPYWHPLYEAMVALDVPGLIHSAGSCSERESYTLKFLNEETISIVSLLGAKTFDTFPDLKIVVAHGGGAIPYQMGRFRSWNVRKGEKETFDEQLKKLYFDTCNYSSEAMELLIKVAGSDNVMFGTEKPGTGSARGPGGPPTCPHSRTGRQGGLHCRGTSAGTGRCAAGTAGTAACPGSPGGSSRSCRAG